MSRVRIALALATSCLVLLAVAFTALAVETDPPGVEDGSPLPGAAGPEQEGPPTDEDAPVPDLGAPPGPEPETAEGLPTGPGDEAAAGEAPVTEDVDGEAEGTLGGDALPPIGHVFIVVLENKDYEETFQSDNPDTRYLGKVLPEIGQLLTDYYGTGHFSLGNYITMISGQSENTQTQADCTAGFNDIEPGVRGPGDQAVGSGCVYPQEFETIADQLEEEGLTWGGFMEDMGLDRERDNSAHPNREGETCAHPRPGKPGDQDQTQAAEEDDQYATRHNPFVYFRSIIDSDSCDESNVPLDRLPDALRSVESTPNYTFITPDLCSDGHDSECVNPDQEGGYAGIDEFLREWVPRILKSPAFKKDGVLIVTFDEAEVDPDRDDDQGANTGSEACCFVPDGPNTALQGGDGPGGGKAGTVVISPFVEQGSVNEKPYNHYDLLHTTEDIFDLPYLGYAGAEDRGSNPVSERGVESFGADVFGRASDPKPVPVPGEDDGKGNGRRESGGRSRDRDRSRDRGDDGGGSPDSDLPAPPAWPLGGQDLRPGVRAECLRFPQSFPSATRRFFACVTAGTIAVSISRLAPDGLPSPASAACRSQGLSGHRRRGQRRSDLAACRLAVERAIAADSLPRVAP